MCEAWVPAAMARLLSGDGAALLVANAFTSHRPIYDGDITRSVNAGLSVPAPTLSLRDLRNAVARTHFERAAIVVRCESIGRRQGSPARWRLKEDTNGGGL
jgi:hypothetical protein